MNLRKIYLFATSRWKGEVKASAEDSPLPTSHRPEFKVQNTGAFQMNTKFPNTTPVIRSLKIRISHGNAKAVPVGIKFLSARRLENALPALLSRRRGEPAIRKTVAPAPRSRIELVND